MLSAATMASALAQWASIGVGTMSPIAQLWAWPMASGFLSVGTP